MRVIGVKFAFCEDEAVDCMVEEFVPFFETNSSGELRENERLFSV